MRIKLYTTLGFLTWEGIKLVARRKLQQNKVKLGAGATVLAVLVAGLAIARANGSDDDD
jgi:hypothetical protein